MLFELHHTVTSKKWADETQRDLYEYANKKSKSNPYLIHFSGLYLSMASNAIATAGKIWRVGEIAMKANVNIFGAPFVKNCDFLKGMKQLFIQLPISVLQVLLSPLPIIFNLIADTGGMLLSPEAYSNWKKTVHETEVKDNTAFSQDPYQEYPDDLLTQHAVFLYR